MAPTKMGPISTLRYLCGMLAVLRVPASVRAGGAGKFDCSSNDGTGLKFMSNAQTFIKGVCCTQAGETCNGLYPTTCASVSCSRALSQVGPPCLQWLAEPGQEMFEHFKTQLQTSVDTCSHTDDAPPGITLLTGSTQSLSNACGARVVDGRSESSTSWQDDLLLSAPDGMVLEVVFESQWLPTPDVLKFHDGKDRDAPELAQFKGTDKPDGPTVASGRQLFMSLFSDGENEGKAVGL